uniref:Integrase core domain containing protein n=1 Tax=Solanum tuberosum TaxID=4113 RepID=M1DVL0_SOLTU
MMRRFDATDENVKEMRNDLSGIGQKVDAHAVSIKHLKQQMTQLSTIVNPRQPGTLPSNTIQNPKIDRHCMAITTQGVSKPFIHLCRLGWKLRIVKMMMRSRSMKQSNELQSVSAITYRFERGSELRIEERLGVEVRISFETKEARVRHEKS